MARHNWRVCSRRHGSSIPGIHPDDVVIYDAQGYEALKSLLIDHCIRYVLLTEYATDMCFCATAAGYKNLSGDINVFLVRAAMLATFPANTTPRPW